MGKSIYVGSYEEMERAAQRLQEQAENYTNIYTKLLQEANTMGASWEGSDNQAYVAQINGIADDLKAMATKLTNASVTLRQQKENYIVRQDDNTSQVKKLVN